MQVKGHKEILCSNYEVAKDGTWSLLYCIMSIHCISIVHVLIILYYTKVKTSNDKAEPS